jgi:hypothetical protein
VKPQIELPSLDVLKEYFELDPTIPNGLRWKRKASKNTVIGNPAGRESVFGYWEVRLDKVLYKSHRIIYKIHTGVDPIGFEIDHYDRNKSNNNPSNLSMATRADQQTNVRVRGAVPYRNVCIDNSRINSERFYMSFVKKGTQGKKINRFLGYYSNPYEASLVALLWKKENGMRWEYAPAGTQ